jgi:hypothetical protein
MRATELRIGNWVALKSGTIESIVLELNYDKVHLQGNVIINREDQIKGIPLTEEWLLKFGFDSKECKKGHTAIICGSTYFVLTYPQIMGEWQVDFCWVFDQFKFVELKYVHQLQNLYFALCGKELTIKSNQT